MQLTGSQIVIECLKEQGVDTVFGYPGGSILNIYDELYKHSDEIKHILTSHEQGASHAADGYARATGKVGVCFATSGPGATNLVTGIATAYMDSVPMVAITANVTLPLLGKDSFQEVDIAGVTMPITKHGYIVKDVTKLADTIREAFQIAKSGRPGPVLVDITKDATANKCEFTPVKPETPALKNAYSEQDIDVALELIKNAKKPYIYLGGGAVISNASREVKEFAEKIQAPVCDTLMAKGAFDGKSAMYTGMIGMHGTKTSNYGVSQCDLLIALGARFSDRVIGNPKKFAENAKILQIDIDAAEVNKNIKTDAAVIGDLKTVLKELNSKREQQNHDAWIAQIQDMKAAIHALGRLTAVRLMEQFNRIAGLEGLSREEIRSSGYVVDTLEAALWCVLKTDSYRDCVLTAVNLGEDTDTVAAVAGGLAGIAYGCGGANGIPDEWIAQVPRREWIQALCEKMEAHF